MADSLDEPLPTTAEQQLIREHVRAGDASAGRYTLGPTIARGGMGEIVAARDEQIGREVAVKRMRELDPNERQTQRFLREACIQGRLEHPAIVPVHELGRDGDGRPFFAMKKLAGTTLTKILEGPHARQRVLRAFADVCLAIEFAHTRGVIHRDIKPDNVMLGDFGETYVLDWGVAKVRGEGDGDFPSSPDQLATRAGVAIGTIGYMSPEQSRAEPDVDGRADVYALGAVLFEILAGEPMHPRTGTTVTPREKIDCRPSVRAPRREIPPELDATVVAATALDRDHRIATARELGERVERYLDGDRDHLLRRELAAQHLEHARSAFEDREDQELQRIAIREAGRALALDPTLEGAAELVGRLMLEPPRHKPKEVEAAIAEDVLQVLAHNARTGAWGYLGYLAFLPTMFLTGEISLALVLIAAIAANLGMVLWNGYVKPGPRPFRLAIGNALLIGIIARLFSPFLIAPSIGAVIAMMLVYSPAYRKTTAVVMLTVTMTLGAIIPWFLELLGVISHTVELTATGLVIDAPGLHLSDPVKIVFLSLYAFAVIAASTGMSHAMRRAERQNRERLLMQAWQLRQLVMH